MERTAMVLVVAESAELRDRIAHAARGQFTLWRAGTPEAALESAQRQTPAVVIVDADLGRAPEAFATRMKSLAPAVRLVFVTSGRDTNEATRLTRFGTVVPKPVDVDRLVHAVQNALRLQGMSEGIHKLRATSSGQFTAIRAEDALALLDAAPVTAPLSPPPVPVATTRRPRSGG